LWPQSKRLENERRPEIAQVELSQLALELAAWGSDSLPWLDAPPSGPLAQARDLLQQLGALDANQRITPLGQRMLALGANPRLAAALLRADVDERALAADCVALVDARSPLRGAGARNDDFRVRVQALRAWRERDPGLRELGADRDALVAISRAAQAWRDRGGGIPAIVPDREDRKAAIPGRDLQKVRPLPSATSSSTPFPIASRGRMRATHAVTHSPTAAARDSPTTARSTASRGSSSSTCATRRATV
jgi:HrpA-like RNA helicase